MKQGRRKVFLALPLHVQQLSEPAFDYCFLTQKVPHGNYRPLRSALSDKAKGNLYPDQTGRILEGYPLHPPCSCSAALGTRWLAGQYINYTNKYWGIKVPRILVKHRHYLLINESNRSLVTGAAYHCSLHL